MQLDRDPSENSSTTSCCHFDGIVLLSWTMIFVLKNSQQGVCVSCAIMRSLQEPSVEGLCTQHHPICCHWERDLRETMFEIQKKKCSWCHQLHHMYNDWGCEIQPKGIFMNLAPTCAFYSFSLECRVCLCASCVLSAHTEHLAEPPAVFIPKSLSSLYKPSLASSFQLLLEVCVWHLSPLTSLDPLGWWINIWGSPRLHCCACAQSQQGQRGTDGSQSPSRPFTKESHGN